MPLIYIPNRGPHNYAEAERFGDLVYCTTGSLDKFDTAEMFRELSDAMFDSQPEDFILLTSLTSLCSIACAIFAAKHQRVNLLIHKNNEGYVKRELHLRSLVT